MSNESKRILGVWDLSRSPINLGGLIILLEELTIQRRIYRTKSVDLCVIGNGKDCPNLPALPDIESKISSMNNDTCREFVLLSTARSFAGIEKCYFFESHAAFQSFLRQSSNEYITWPTFKNSKISEHQYGRTSFIQEYYHKYGRIPLLSLKEELSRWAVRFIDGNVFPSMPVAVHLKNNPNENENSNADFNEWFAFFEKCASLYDVKFILIGNEKMDDRIRDLPNILITRDLNIGLIKELALAQTCSVFMGMASGPCNIAIFSDVPYIIFKNPDHHPEEMMLELGEEDRYPFANRFQKLVRKFENRENLLIEFVFLYEHAKRQFSEKRRVA